MLPPDIVLRAVPAEWQDKIALGTVRLVGNLILPTSGPNRILAQLQPTALADAATSLLPVAGAGMVGGPVGGLGMAALQMTKLAGSVYQGYETGKLRAAVETMQTLQLTGLALSGIGIGVSLAGFAVVAHRLRGIEDRLATMTDRLDAIQHRLDRRERMERVSAFERLRTMAERVDHAWDRNDAAGIWREEERELQLSLRNFLALADLALAEADGFALAESLIEAAAVAATTRTTALLALEEMTPALRHGEEFASALVARTTPIGVVGLIAQRLTLKRGDPGHATARVDAQAAAERDVALLRTREDMAQTAPLTIRRLRTLGIGGREWLMQARAERESPFLVLTNPETA